MTGTARPSPAADAVTPEQAGRFAAECSRFWNAGDLPGVKLGLAVSGGPDSVALLLLAHAVRPGTIEAATVDHGLRANSAVEAAMVADLCGRLGVPHRTLAVTVPEGNLQEKAREARYDALARWAREREIYALATAHHADDQAETVLMRLNRSSGLSGLAGIRPVTSWPLTGLMLLRPLLTWRKAELTDIVVRAGIEAAADPSNVDPRFDRARIRKELAACDWIDPAAVARSAGNLADAEAALNWAVLREWDEKVRQVGDGGYAYNPDGVPRAIMLRLVQMAIARTCGQNCRGSSVARLVDELAGSGRATLGGTLVEVKDGVWTFRAETPRRR